jgi:hypothetical protein
MTNIAHAAALERVSAGRPEVYCVAQLELVAPKESQQANQVVKQYRAVHSTEPCRPRYPKSSDLGILGHAAFLWNSRVERVNDEAHQLGDLRLERECFDIFSCVSHCEMK